MVSFHHKVAAEGKFIVVMSAEVEGKEIPALESDGKGCEAGCRRELEDALALVKVDAKTDQLFFWVTDSFLPAGDGAKDNVFITATYDATTHFESATREVLRLYQQITGKALDLSTPPEPEKEPGEEEKEGKEEGGGPSDDGGAAEVAAALDAAEAPEGAAAAPAPAAAAAAAPVAAAAAPAKSD